MKKPIAPKDFRSLADIRAGGAKLKRKEVWVEEWETFLYARQLNALEFQEFRKYSKELKTSIETRGEEELTAEDLVPILIISLETGAHEKLDAELLMSLPESSLARLGNEVMAINGITSRAVEQLEKNSETREGATSSDSPIPSDTPTPTSSSKS